MEERKRVSLRCPSCRAGRLSPAGGSNGTVRCDGCRAFYPVMNGVIDLLPSSTTRRKLGQFLMEWEPVIRVYESSWWRKNPLFALYTGVSFDREFELVARAANLSGEEWFLDLACGSGIYARPMARRLERGHLVGLDLSAPMLRVLGRKAEAQGLENLTLVRGSALDLPFEDCTFHAVNCCGALHLFSDVARALGEIRRVLRPGGGFTAAVLGRPPGKGARRIAGLQRRWLGIHAFEPGEFQSLLTSAGFVEEKVLHHRDGWGWRVVHATT
jgi:SAM-dependent methyltransferase